MQYFERVYIHNCPDVDLLIFDVEFRLIDRDRRQAVAVGLKEVLESMIPIVNRNMTHLNERLKPTERQPRVIHEPSEDTPLGRRVLPGKYFFLPCLLDNVVEHF